jgi:Fe-S oxidoreductase/nitrate reductase gamma subunit
MPERFDYWGIPLSWRPDLIVYSIMALAAIILIIRFYQRASLWWKVGRYEMRWDKLHIRLGRLISYGIIQIKILKQRYPGIMHVALAWSFFVFFLGTALATLDSHFFKFLVGNPYLLYKLILDTFTIFFLIGAGMAIYRRYFQKPPRLTFERSFTWSLILLILIVLGGLTTESLRLAVDKPAWAWWAPAGWSLAQLWVATGASAESLTGWHSGIWGFHLLIVAATLITLPVGTLVHVLTGPLNTFFSKLDRPVGQLQSPALNAQGDPIFPKSLPDLTWKQLLDSDACTECGRCQDSCPAHAAGTSLSPKQLILNIRNTLHQDGPSLARRGKNGGSTNPDTPQLIGYAITDDALWSCTSCGACVRECPVLIEHVDTIVEMRRYLVIEGRLDGMLQDALANLGRYGNSFGQSDRMRARWSQAIQPKIKDARREPVDYLWFVGDYASYNATLSDITQKTADVFQHAGLDYGILYDGERNAGNDVRRVGEEGLFEMLVEKNKAVMEKSTYKAIVTTDPHSYNALKNEYHLNGTPVLHYTELLDQLIASGKLTLSQKPGLKVTFHDPCYLGRYNGVYDAPRRILSALGCNLIEMPRNREQAFCCGAGGGRIWMEEGTVKERPSEARINEAIGLDGVEVFVVACPKDFTMFRDAVKTTGQENRIIVKDIIELVHAAL